MKISTSLPLSRLQIQHSCNLQCSREATGNSSMLNGQAQARLIQQPALRSSLLFIFRYYSGSTICRSLTRSNQKSCFSSPSFDLLRTISPSSAEEVHHLPRGAAAPRMIRVRRPIPVISLLLVCLGELAVVLDKYTSPTRLFASRGLPLCLSTAIVILVEAALILLSSVLEIHKR